MKTMSCNSTVVKSGIAVHAQLSPSSSPPQQRRSIAFTTPSNYADRLSRVLAQKLINHQLLWCPTVIVESTPHTQQSLLQHLSSGFDYFSAIAFTSRTGITSFSDVLQFNELNLPLLPPNGPPLAVSALGKDADLLTPDFISKLCSNPSKIKILVPPVATPTSMVESLGVRHGCKILCPVPDVIGLHEPRVVPDFLRALELKGWVPVRVSAYETRWGGVNCAAPLLEQQLPLAAIVFTSTAEVEGLLKSLRGLGLAWDALMKRYPELIVAAHGPVTAAGANSLGVTVDVVSSRFGSFDGVVEALASKILH